MKGRNGKTRLPVRHVSIFSIFHMKHEKCEQLKASACNRKTINRSQKLR